MSTEQMTDDQSLIAGAEGAAPVESHSEHPTPLLYFKVAMTLVVLTILEVVLFLVDALSYGIIPVIAVLSVAKFVLVGMFYMHLRYDHKLFYTLFVTGLILAVSVVFAVIGLFSWFDV
jgi:cytochrome c oxidase subunit 4